MASNYTENYGLCQWEATDAVLHTDFNGDNAKLEKALSDLAEARERLDRVAINMAYYTGRLVTQQMIDSGKYPPQRAMICEPFLNSTSKELTGGAVIQNNTLFLNGTGASGSLTMRYLSVNTPVWTQARMWVHYNRGNLVPSINGEEMTLIRSTPVASVTWAGVGESEFFWEGTGTGSVDLSLNFNTGTSESMTIYDFYIIFF